MTDNLAAYDHLAWTGVAGNNIIYKSGFEYYHGYDNIVVIKK
jgi:hypothetical protein